MEVASKDMEQPSIINEAFSKTSYALSDTSDAFEEGKGAVGLYPILLTLYLARVRKV